MGYKIFSVFVIYFAASLYYFSSVLPYEKIVKGSFFGDSETRIYALDRILVLVGAVIFLAIEVFQLKKGGFSYFSDFWNYVYLTSNILAII